MKTHQQFIYPEKLTKGELIKFLQESDVPDDTEILIMTSEDEGYCSIPHSHKIYSVYTYPSYKMYDKVGHRSRIYPPRIEITVY